jgi:putative hydroxymethylpyrimidine transport system substrate-binding protein
VAALLLAGCGGSGGEETASAEITPLYPPREVHLVLDGYAGAATAGIVMAERRGYFDDLGIEISISTPASPERPVRYTVEDAGDIAVSHQPEVAMAVEKGSPIVAVGSLISQPTASFIWLKKSGIGGIADLKGKTIAFAGLPFQKELLSVLLGQAGLTLADVKLERAEYETVPALVSGRADAIFGASANIEGAELETRGLEPVVTGVGDLGVPGYEELVLIVRSKELSHDPPWLRNFMAAVKRGTAAALEDPKATANAISSNFNASSDVSRKAMEAEVEATLPLLSRDGRMDPSQVEGLTRWMLDEGMLGQPLSPSELLTNDYLAP